MAREIQDYQSLQDAIADWLNRAALTARIPTFIYLAERMIFRRYRNPNNEKTLTYDMRVNPDGGDPAQLTLSDQIPFDTDYLETLVLMADGKPLQRVSLTELQSRQFASRASVGVTQQGEPERFARHRGRIEVHPFPTGDTLFTHIYYCDFSGQLIEGDDDNDVLRTAPDLYLYGSLIQAQPFLKPTDDEWQLIPTWEKMYGDAFALVEYQRDEDERSGSNVEIKSSFGGGAVTHARFGGNS